MKTILVTGASGIIGYGILRSLRKSGKDLRLIGTTIYNDSVAPAFCDIFELAPPTDDASYIDWLLRIIKKHEVDLIIPGIEIDIYKWVEHIPELEKSTAKIMLNNTGLIKLCRDKWVFYQSLCKLGATHAIETTLDSDYNNLVKKFGLPFLLKPRRGDGSKGIVRIETAEEFAGYQNDIGPLLMVQPIVGNENDEYTTSAFCDGMGRFYTSMTLRRKLSKEGFTEKAEVVHLDKIIESLRVLCAYFKPVGPTNFQFREHEGSLKLLEINPRISSATSIRTAFGYNECTMAIEYFLENKLPTQPVIKSGRAVRYTEDFIFYGKK
ncbi:MAG: carbamoyl-phosphate synthase subunit L [Candidatus Kerfeldbacteria bacterium CG08_land_8_20_14_0_20_40_16]|uniref:Carbamoyl-phosphate synthase subunit L n=1 Tax=Candidatus Kerfeldbacteria bacterium CG08_land_8_20_14_0_20_40_16 TaxID=2014244 RepID=A0A2H0YXV9_9BACT|nr:MAG: carbamoyl-phosphate synthase subunit L [Candidatus Kerfeldbacteria bacterium CG08_land_8_20_14_0_20_40_16]